MLSPSFLAHSSLGHNDGRLHEGPVESRGAVQNWHTVARPQTGPSAALVARRTRSWRGRDPGQAHARSLPPTPAPDVVLHGPTSNLHAAGRVASGRGRREQSHAASAQVVLVRRPPYRSEQPVRLAGDQVGAGDQYRERRAAVAHPGAGGCLGDAVLGRLARRDHQHGREAGVVARGLAAGPVAVVGVEFGCVAGGPLGGAVVLEEKAERGAAAAVAAVAVRFAQAAFAGRSPNATLRALRPGPWRLLGAPRLPGRRRRRSCPACGPGCAAGAGGGLPSPGRRSGRGAERRWGHLARASRPARAGQAGSARSTRAPPAPARAAPMPRVGCPWPGWRATSRGPPARRAAVPSGVGWCRAARPAGPDSGRGGARPDPATADCWSSGVRPPGRTRLRAATCSQVSTRQRSGGSCSWAATSASSRRQAAARPPRPSGSGVAMVSTGSIRRGSPAAARSSSSRRTSARWRPTGAVPRSGSSSTDRARPS